MGIKVGDRVKYVGEMHEVVPWYYPSVGTVGVVVNVEDNVRVKWPDRSTTSEFGDTWWVAECELEVIEEE